MSQPHRPDCPRGDACTLDSPMLASADIARARGWAAGTRLVGTEDHKSDIIIITAVGEELILARSYRGESIWTLRHRCWGVA